MSAVRTKMNSGQNKQGLALVAVLWIVVVMTAIVAVVSQTGRLNMKMSTAAMDQARLKWTCRAGLEMAIAVLNQDDKNSDSLSDSWNDDPEDLNDVQMERSAYTAQITDEAGKLNINTATKEQLMALPLMESAIADAILDWRDTDDTPNPEGAESGYYENLQYPYTPRNGPLHTVREMLRVKGVTEQQLYGKDTNLNGQPDYNGRAGGLGALPGNGDEIPDQGWIAFLTCYSYDNNVDAQGQSRVNINQANEQQLQSQLGISNAQARWIVQNRGGGFKSIADLISDSSPKEPSSSTNTSTSTDTNSSTNNRTGANTNAGNTGNPGGSPGNTGNPGNANEPPQPIDLQTFGQIVDKITITGETKLPGRVNINTAPVEVLTAMFGGDETSRQTALAIIGDRAGRPYGFESIGDLLSVQSMSTAKFKAIADLVTVRSNVFTVRCTAVAAVSYAKMQIEYVVDRGSNPCTILYSYQGANY
jgi:general secretion pathway protein K